ncbi:NAD(P)H-quinone oxidoreductase chain 4 [Medicago truncatula]|uniref:NAD(P)H-quinone oxidoreductase chain 4 n=1 Tax=Medicago truncatula TaxID=3880 RepID=G7J2X6_MEDTR|nr:NAD(P)H-quinone oxidoreductase chain 4 [Medicago truncatula]
MEAYGLVRINMELFFHAHSIFCPWLDIRFCSNNLCRFNIFWSISFVMIDYRLLYLDEMGGMTIPMPKIFTIFTILSMTSFALSGMSGFVAELIVFFGIITSQKYIFLMKILS